MKSVVITGASSGIGRASAKAAAEAGFQVFGSVRKQADADALKAEIGTLFIPLFFDVSDNEAIEAAADLVSKSLKGERLAGLVNNAGIALPGPALTQPWDEIVRVNDINFLGAVRTTRAFAPLLGATGEGDGAPGRIVNITSVSGKFGYPFTASYVAAKHALEGFSDSLRRELMLTGVDVIVVGPGAVKTPIWDKGAGFDKSQYVGSIWEKPLQKLVDSLKAMDQEGLSVEAVAATVVEALTVPKPKTRYAPVRNPLVNWWLPRLLPARTIDRFVAGQLGLTKS